MGILRFILATLVLVSHLGHSLWGLNPGVVAVVVFYILAGHVVARLWSGRPESGWSDGVRWFYRDRFWRIVPQYLLVLVAAAWVWTTGPATPFLARQPGLADWLANLAIVPLNYYMFTGQAEFTLVPPAWSLAAELQYYLLAPLLLSLSRGTIKAAMILSLCIFLLAQAGVLHTDHWGYRLLPGILFIFLSGALLRQDPADRFLWTVWSAFVLYAGYLLFLAEPVPYRLEVTLGLVIGLPLVALLEHPRPILPALCARFQRIAGPSSRPVLTQPLPSGDLSSQRHPAEPFGSAPSPAWSAAPPGPTRRRINAQLGGASYGVFLWHFPVIWWFGYQPPVLGLTEFIHVFTVSLLLSVLAHNLLERPIWKHRRQRARNPARS
ncbi:MAG: acyltransferase family protein [Halothiobacillaceae bacterium]